MDARAKPTPPENTNPSHAQRTANVTESPCKAHRRQTTRRTRARSSLLSVPPANFSGSSNRTTGNSLRVQHRNYVLQATSHTYLTSTLHNLTDFNRATPVRSLSLGEYMRRS